MIAGWRDEWLYVWMRDDGWMWDEGTIAGWRDGWCDGWMEGCRDAVTCDPVLTCVDSCCGESSAS